MKIDDILSLYKKSTINKYLIARGSQGIRCNRAVKWKDIVVKWTCQFMGLDIPGDSDDHSILE